MLYLDHRAVRVLRLTQQATGLTVEPHGPCLIRSQGGQERGGKLTPPARGTREHSRLPRPSCFHTFTSTSLQSPQRKTLQLLVVAGSILGSPSPHKSALQ